LYDLSFTNFAKSRPNGLGLMVDYFLFTHWHQAFQLTQAYKVNSVAFVCFWSCTSSSLLLAYCFAARPYPFQVQ